MQSILELASSADTLATLLSATVIAILALIKVGSHLWHRFKKTEKDMDGTSAAHAEALESSLEVISDSYVSIIKHLREEVDRLKEDVEELGVLRDQHEECQKQIVALQEENKALREQNSLQERQITRLTNRVNKLTVESKKKARKSK